MRRIKMASAESEATYHCMSRVVNSERILDVRARGVLRKQLWQIAEYCGVEIVTYALMTNHFHVLVRVPKTVQLSDGELLRRHRVLYPMPTRWQAQKLEEIEHLLKQGGEEAERWRKRHLALMFDVSQYMKLLKQRFTIWFNKTHNRHGTLWSERFKSVLVESDGEALRTMALYIDLNCVRAGLAEDPKDHRFCGYAEAVAGNKRARAGYQWIGRGRPWDEIHAVYRQWLMGTGTDPREGKQVVTPELLQQTVAKGGQLPLRDVLRCKLRYLSDGIALGGREFVENIARQRAKSLRVRPKPPRPLPALAPGWFANAKPFHDTAAGTDNSLHTLRGPRKSTFG
jgi:REP element-mobilizing transposase RayT